MFIQGERRVHESLGKGDEVIFGTRGHIHESWWYVGVTVKLGLLLKCSSIVVQDLGYTCAVCYILQCTRIPQHRGKNVSLTFTRKNINLFCTWENSIHHCKVRRVNACMSSIKSVTGN